MARYPRYYGSRYHRKNIDDIGLEMARRHIAEAREFSDEIGGNDTDVKKYLFSLPFKSLELIFVQYGKQYGIVAENYARESFNQWKNGTKKMSGLIAKRLFNLVPPLMPLEKKYELAENIWRHFGPKSAHAFTIGPDADIDSLASLVSSQIDNTVTSYNIPTNIKARFNWLAAGDISKEEILLNYLREKQKKLVIDIIKFDVVNLKTQLNNNLNKNNVKKLTKEFNIYNHSIKISIDPSIKESILDDNETVTPKNSPNWYIIFIIVAILFLFFGKK